MNPTSHNISLIRVCKEHLDELADDLRLADRRELWACYRLRARDGLELCVRYSVETVAFLYEGKIAAVAGIAPMSLLGNEACVWSWTGRQVLKCPKAFLTVSKLVVKRFKRLYPHLYAACDVRYKQAGRYLECLGAQAVADRFFLAGTETSFQWYQWK